MGSSQLNSKAEWLSNMIQEMKSHLYVVFFFLQWDSVYRSTVFKQDVDILKKTQRIIRREI